VATKTADPKPAGRPATAPAAAAPAVPKPKHPLKGAAGWANLNMHDPAKPAKWAPVDADGRRTNHLRLVCLSHDTVAGVRRPCPRDAWVLDAAETRYCPRHGVVLHREGRTDRPAEPLLPWADMGRAVGPTLRPLWLLAAEFACAVAAHDAHVPTWQALAAAPTLAGVGYAATSGYLTGRARKRGRIEEGQDVGRRVDTIRRRARAGAYAGAAGGLWLSAAAVCDPATTVGRWVWSAFPLLSLAAVPYWRYVAGLRGRPAGNERPAAPADLAEMIQVWAARVGHPAGVLAGTRLVEPKPVRGGWSGRIVSDNPGAIDPDRFRTAAGRVAAAYELAVQDVEVEPLPGNASQATICVYRDNPLAEPKTWPGPAATWLWEEGLSLVGRFSDDAAAYYRWFNDGGPWHDLISGATGAGKSEFVNMLLLSELHSDGLILSRVCDPQHGQSYGALQDHVDWFAPTVAEMRLLLLDTVKEMLRRNRLYSRRRQKTWRPTRELPLIVVTVDEAHEVLKDPICLALVEKLAKMARKCGIKLRLITQVPLVTELGGSTPIKDALLAGQVIVFRTGSPLSGQVAFNGSLPVDPHKLPRVWPDGSPWAGKTTAGLAYMLGTSERSAKLRTFYTGEDLSPWLVDADGRLTIVPGVPDQDWARESGPLWGNRRERIRALLDAPVDADDILPGGLVAALVAQAGGAPTPAASPVPAFDAQDCDAKGVVLRVAAAAAGPDGRVKRADIRDRCINPKTGKPYSVRALSDGLTALDRELLLVRVNPDANDGLYEVTAKGRAAVAAAVDEAREMVDELVGVEQ
jgi:hypothetical protein